jgi:hypothetical protein
MPIDFFYNHALVPKDKVWNMQHSSQDTQITAIITIKILA